MHAPGSHRYRIAVVDDDTVFLELMHDLLALGEGYEVLTSANWVGCYDFIKQASPDLVILDLMLGRDQTGWAVLDLVRSDPTTQHIPVILCSAAAHALENHAAYLRGQAAVECVSKPFDVDDLLGSIERLLQGASATTA